MKNLLKKHYKKIIAFSILKKVFLVSFLFYTSVYSDETVNDVYFTDYEVNATLYLANYYNYQTFKDCYIGSSDSKKIIQKREDDLYTDIQDLADRATLNEDQLHYLKQQSHLIDWNKYTNDFGMTLTQTNFAYAIIGLLIGFTFLFFTIYSIVGSL